MTQLKHLKCLSAVKSTANIHFLTPAAFPGTHCPMHTALGMGTKIRGISTLVVGTNECGMYSRNIPQASPYFSDTLHWVYVLDGREVIFGCRDGLSKAVLEMDQAGAEVILLLSTCVPEVIGEDMQAIAHALAPQLTAKLITVPLGNFKCLSYQPGYWQTLLAMSALIKPAKKKCATVNVMGRSPFETHSPMPDVLQALEMQGIKLRFLAPDATVNDFYQAGEGVLNLVLSPFLHPLAQWMQDEMQVPFFSLHDLYAPESIGNIYQKIETALGVTLNFPENCKRAVKLEKQFSALAAGKACVYANIGASQPLPMVHYLATLGLHPVLVHMEDIYPSDAFWRRKLTEIGENPIVCLMVNEASDIAVIEALQPDLVLGDLGGRQGSIAGVPFLMDMYGKIGYERTATLLERLLQAIGGSEHGTL